MEICQTGRKDRYELMCDVDAYYRIHSSRPDNIDSVGGIPAPNTSSIDALEPLGHTINFINNWLQCF